MSPQSDRRPPPRLALKPAAAAESLDVSRNFFDREILPELRIIRKGRLKLIPVSSIEEWIAANKSRPLVDELA